MLAVRFSSVEIWLLWKLIMTFRENETSFVVSTWIKKSDILNNLKPQQINKSIWRGKLLGNRACAVAIISEYVNWNILNPDQSSNITFGIKMRKYHGLFKTSHEHFSIVLKGFLYMYGAMPLPRKDVFFKNFIFI